VKALGNQLGRFVLVFNCDETFDFQVCWLHFRETAIAPFPITFSLELLSGCESSHFECGAFLHW
jgi:hypothetical protein